MKVTTSGKLHGCFSPYFMLQAQIFNIKCTIHKLYLRKGRGGVGEQIKECILTELWQNSEGRFSFQEGQLTPNPAS